LDFGNLNIFIGAPLNEVGQNVMLEHLKVEGRSVGQTFLSLLRSFFLIFGGILIDSLTDVNEGAVFYLEIVLLQFALDIFDQQLIADASQLLLKLCLLVVINDGYQDFVDESQTVAAHEDVISVIDSLSKGLEEGVMPILLFEQLETLHDGDAVFNLPAVVLKHQQNICCDCYVDRMVSTQKNDCIIVNISHACEVLLGGVV